MKLEFTIHSQLRGGKNNYMVTRLGHHVPRKEWAEWRNMVVADLKFYLAQINFKKPFDAPVKITVLYCPGDNRRRDIPALMDSLFHICERAGVVKDDWLFRECKWDQMSVDKGKSAVMVEIEELYNRTP